MIGKKGIPRLGRFASPEGKICLIFRRENPFLFPKTESVSFPEGVRRRRRRERDVGVLPMGEKKRDSDKKKFIITFLFFLL